MTLLLITLLNAHADDTTTPQYAAVTTIDFEDLDITLDTKKPQMTVIQETKRPVFKSGYMIDTFIIGPMLRPLTLDPEEIPELTGGE